MNTVKSWAGIEHEDEKTRLPRRDRVVVHLVDAAAAVGHGAAARGARRRAAAGARVPRHDGAHAQAGVPHRRARLAVVDVAAVQKRRVGAGEVGDRARRRPERRRVGLVAWVAGGGDGAGKADGVPRVSQSAGAGAERRVGELHDGDVVGPGARRGGAGPGGVGRDVRPFVLLLCVMFFCVFWVSVSVLEVPERQKMRLLLLLASEK